MKMLSVSKAALLVASLVGQAQADSLKNDLPWEEVISQHRSLVFGRFEGKYDGPEFRSRKIRLVNDDTGREFLLAVKEGLGYFHELLPPGRYRPSALEATYFPPIRPFDPKKFRPIRQRFSVRPDPGAATPFFLVPTGRPVYIGTILASTATDGIVYKGHHLRILDEYDEAVARLAKNFPKLAASLASRGIVPARHFMLKPTVPESPLELVGVENPIRRARDYIADGKFRQAVNWLQTFMPTSDEERTRVDLLIGEALLADGKYPEAIERLGEVLQVDPENLRALRLLARAHALNSDQEDAFGLYQALAQALPDDAEAHLQVGYLYALRDEPSRSAQAFTSAFRKDFDYLLHDLVPLIVALKAVKSEDAVYEPPMAVRNVVRPPSTLRSRRGAKGGLALLIDHRGRVVAAQLTPESSGWLPAIMMSVIRATFKPAALNGIPVPALLTIGGDAGGPQQQQ